MPFRYLRDPVFLVAVLLYVVNRFVLKKIWTSSFCHEHFNDLLCLPFWIPILIWMKKSLKWRTDDGPPTRSELIIPLVMWSVIFELLLPNTEWFAAYCTADYQDILWYAIGACIANIVWQWIYRPQDQPPEDIPPAAQV